MAQPSNVEMTPTPYRSFQDTMNVLNDHSSTNPGGSVSGDTSPATSSPASSPRIEAQKEQENDGRARISKLSLNRPGSTIRWADDYDEPSTALFNNPIGTAEYFPATNLSRSTSPTLSQPDTLSNSPQWGSNSIGSLVSDPDYLYSQSEIAAPVEDFTPVNIQNIKLPELDPNSKEYPLPSHDRQDGRLAEYIQDSEQTLEEVEITAEKREKIPFWILFQGRLEAWRHLLRAREHLREDMRIKKELTATIEGLEAAYEDLKSKDDEKFQQIDFAEANARVFELRYEEARKQITALEEQKKRWDTEEGGSIAEKYDLSRQLQNKDIQIQNLKKMNDFLVGGESVDDPEAKKRKEEADQRHQVEELRYMVDVVHDRDHLIAEAQKERDKYKEDRDKLLEELMVYRGQDDPSSVSSSDGPGPMSVPKLLAETDTLHKELGKVKHERDSAMKTLGDERAEHKEDIRRTHGKFNDKWKELLSDYARVRDVRDDLQVKLDSLEEKMNKQKVEHGTELRARERQCAAQVSELESKIESLENKLEQAEIREENLKQSQEALSIEKAASKRENDWYHKNIKTLKAEVDAKLQADMQATEEAVGTLYRWLKKAELEPSQQKSLKKDVKTVYKRLESLNLGHKKLATKLGGLYKHSKRRLTRSMSISEQRREDLAAMFAAPRRANTTSLPVLARINEGDRPNLDERDDGLVKLDDMVKEDETLKRAKEVIELMEDESQPVTAAMLRHYVSELRQAIEDSRSKEDLPVATQARNEAVIMPLVAELEKQQQAKESEESSLREREARDQKITELQRRPTDAGTDHKPAQNLMDELKMLGEDGDDEDEDERAVDNNDDNGNNDNNDELAAEKEKNTELRGELAAGESRESELRAIVHLYQERVRKLVQDVGTENILHDEEEYEDEGLSLKEAEERRFRKLKQLVAEVEDLKQRSENASDREVHSKLLEALNREMDKFRLGSQIGESLGEWNLELDELRNDIGTLDRDVASHLRMYNELSDTIVMAGNKEDEDRFAKSVQELKAKAELDQRNYDAFTDALDALEQREDVAPAQLRANWRHNRDMEKKKEAQGTDEDEDEDEDGTGLLFDKDEELSDSEAEAQKKMVESQREYIEIRISRMRRVLEWAGDRCKELTRSLQKNENERRRRANSLKRQETFMRRDTMQYKASARKQNSLDAVVGQQQKEGRKSVVRNSKDEQLVRSQLKREKHLHTMSERLCFCALLNALVPDTFHHITNTMNPYPRSSAGHGHGHIERWRIYWRAYLCQLLTSLLWIIMLLLFQPYNFYKTASFGVSVLMGLPVYLVRMAWYWLRYTVHVYRFGPYRHAEEYEEQQGGDRSPGYANDEGLRSPALVWPPLGSTKYPKSPYPPGLSPESDGFELGSDLGLKSPDLKSPTSPPYSPPLISPPPPPLSFPSQLSPTRWLEKQQTSPRLPPGARNRPPKKPQLWFLPQHTPPPAVIWVSTAFSILFVLTLLVHWAVLTERDIWLQANGGGWPWRPAAYVRYLADNDPHPAWLPFNVDFGWWMEPYVVSPLREFVHGLFVSRWREYYRYSSGGHGGRGLMEWMKWCGKLLVGKEGWPEAEETVNTFGKWQRATSGILKGSKGTRGVTGGIRGFGASAVRESASKLIKKAAETVAAAAAGATAVGGRMMGGGG